MRLTIQIDVFLDPTCRVTYDAIEEEIHLYLSKAIRTEIPSWNLEDEGFILRVVNNIEEDVLVIEQNIWTEAYAIWMNLDEITFADTLCRIMQSSLEKMKHDLGENHDIPSLSAYRQ